MPQGKVTAGWPVAQVWQRLLIISKARAKLSSREQPGFGIGCAFMGVVGISSRSWAPSTSS